MRFEDPDFDVKKVPLTAPGAMLVSRYAVSIGVTEDFFHGRAIAQVKDAAEDQGPSDQGLDNALQLMLGMTFCRLFEFLESYFFDVTYMVLSADPKLLNLKKRVTLRDIVCIESFEAARSEIILRAAREQAKELAGNLKSLAAFYDDNRAPLPLDLLLDSWNEWRCTRNLLVHNGGFIDEEYVRENPMCGLGLGDLRRVSFSEILKVAGALSNTMLGCDHVIASRFNLPRKPNFWQGDIGGNSVAPG